MLSTIYMCLLCTIIVYPRTRYMLPMVHVVDLPDWQYPRDSSRGSCNINNTITAHTDTTMSRKIYLGTHVSKYSISPYSCTHTLPQASTPAYRYSCTLPVKLLQIFFPPWLSKSINLYSAHLLSRKYSKKY